MKTLIRTILAGLTLSLLATGAHAQLAGKIAVFSPENAILNTELAKQRLKQLEEDSEFAANQKELETLSADFQKVAEKFRKDSAVMSDDEKGKAQKKLATLRADAEHVSKKLKAAQNETIQRVGAEVGGRLQKILEQLIQDEGIGLLLRSEAVIHASAAYNITSKVTDKLNAGEGK